jgi:membrane-bound lytic murein transglycosylase D
MRANNLKKSNYIVVGRKLKIPQRGVNAVQQTKTRKTTGLKSATHVVRRGDSLWIIARRYGTTTQKIQALNGLRTTNLHIGQVLKITGQRPGPVAAPVSGDYRTYLVKSGDSPFRIAQNHKMPLERFLRINSLTPRSRIFPGQALNVE